MKTKKTTKQLHRPAKKKQQPRASVPTTPVLVVPQTANQRETLRAAGWLRVSEAAAKAGKTIQWVHKHLKAEDGPLTEAEKGSMRIEFLFYVYEPALRKILGDAYSDLRGIRTVAQLPAIVSHAIASSAASA